VFIRIAAPKVPLAWEPYLGARERAALSQAA
jgi:hypothetical protein